MRKVTAAFLITAVFSGGLYTYYWFRKADEFKAMAEQSITQLNAQAKQFGKDVTFLRYESLAVTGYPFFMQLDVTKPVIDLPVAAFAVKPAVAADGAQPQPVPAQTLFEFAYGDRLSIASNLLANEFTLTASGESKVTPIVDGQPQKTLVNDQQSPLACHLGIYNPEDLPWNIPQSFADANAFLAALRYADCHVGGAVTKSAETGEVLASVEDFRIALTSAPRAPETQDIGFTLAISKAKATPAYDVIANQFMQIFYDAAGVPQEQRAKDIQFSQYGEQDNTVDLHYTGPLDKKYWSDPALGFDLQVKAFNAKNDLYEVANTGHLTSAVQGNDRDSSLVIHSSMIAGEKYEKILAANLSRLLTAIAKEPAQGSQLAEEIAKLNKPDELAGAIVPKFHTLGKISFDADVAIKSDNTKSILESGKVTLNAFDVTASQVGLRMKGNGKLGASGIPAGELLATCVACDSMLTGLGDYAIGVDSMLAAVRIGQMSYVSHPLVEGIRQFMHAIDENAADKTSKDVVIHIVSDDSGKITISGKQLLEVIGLFGVNVGQNLQAASQQQNSVKPEAPIKGDKEKKLDDGNNAAGATEGTHVSPPVAGKPAPAPEQGK